MSIQELEEIIEQYGTDVMSFCGYLTGDKLLAEELYQDVFLTALEHKESVQVEENVKSYLLSVAVRLWQNRRRKFAWRRRIAPIMSIHQVDETICDHTDNVETDILEKYISEEEKTLLREAVSHLKEELRIPVYLYYVNDLSVGDIANILGIPQGTVKSRLSTARKKLRKELEERI